MRSSLFGIIGDPIDHSLSPAMHQAAFRALHLPHLYLPLRVPPKALSDFMTRARGWPLQGFNVTIPHKEKILGYLDRVDPQAKAIGAVNTVVCSQGRWTGYNTDGKGYLLSLKHEANFNPRRKKIIVLGAGGAARGVAFALLRAGCSHLTIANRTAAHAQQLIQSLRKSFPKITLKVISLADLSNLGRIALGPMALGSTPDLLVNATSIGLKNTRFLFSLDFLPKSCLVSDLVYRPRLTPLLKQAHRRGMKIHEGWSMLLYQGALSFRLWTGKPAPIDIMKRVLLKQLKMG